MHKKKTGSLLNCSVMFGAILNPNISKKDLSRLDSFSNHIGLAYQVQDDVLDVITSDEILGKRQNSDLVKNKPSYEQSDSNFRYAWQYISCFYSFGS